MQYTGMNCSAFTPSLPVGEKDPNLVLYVGRLVPYKGCDYLLRAMKRVQQRAPGSAGSDRRRFLPRIDSNS